MHPAHRIVIVKTSAYPDYNLDGEAMELESIAMFQSLAAQMGASYPNAATAAFRYQP